MANWAYQLLDKVIGMEEAGRVAVTSHDTVPLTRDAQRLPVH